MSPNDVMVHTICKPFWVVDQPSGLRHQFDGITGFDPQSHKQSKQLGKAIRKQTLKNLLFSFFIVLLLFDVLESQHSDLSYTASALYPQTLSTILPSTGKNQFYGNILLCKTSVIFVKMADHDGNHRCLVEKFVPIALILPRRWQDGAESIGMETTSSLCDCSPVS